eukprot:2982568-Prorocentrum_lima.AAC.1
MLVEISEYRMQRLCQLATKLCCQNQVHALRGPKISAEAASSSEPAGQEYSQWNAMMPRVQA